jgi:tripartite-type tricarboxylate transporter receptor subunit TctC
MRSGGKIMKKTLREAGINVMSASCAVLALWSFTFLSTEVAAQEFPTKPIRLIVGNAPGAAADMIARLIGPRMAEAMGQQIVTDNRPGASGRISAELVARSAPDGYTLLMITSSLTVVAAMYENLNYDLVKDFTPICLLGISPFVLAVHPSVQANSVKELVALAKSRPGMLKYGSSGSGSGPHLAVESLKFTAGIDMLHVPYKGQTPAVIGAVNGEVNMTLQTIPALLPMINSGKLRALGVTSAGRTSLLPDVPAISETVPGYQSSGWYAVASPAKTPPAIVSKLHTEISKALKTSAIRERMADQGIDTIGSSPEEFASFLRGQLGKTKEVVKAAGIRPEK